MSTPRQNHRPIAMTRKSSTRDLKQPGDFVLIGSDDKPVMILMLPATNRRGMALSRWTINHESDNGSKWSWNGDKDKPTLAPSLHAVGLWHGFVRDGLLVEA